MRGGQILRIISPEFAALVRPDVGYFGVATCNAALVALNVRGGADVHNKNQDNGKTYSLLHNTTVKECISLSTSQRGLT